MKYGLDISPAGQWGHPRMMAELASLAEHSGWDGVFLEDYFRFPGGLDGYDPWLTLAAIAVATQRVTIGTLVTPLPRRTAWKVAAEAMTLDHLSDGRVILGVGSGDPASDDLGLVSQVVDAKAQAAALDEALEVVTALWSGEEFSFHGSHVDVTRLKLRPRPVQRPRIPIWIGGSLMRRGPRERALRWDGACLYRVSPPGWEDLKPDDVRTLRRLAQDRRGDDAFVVAVGGRPRREDEDAEIDYVAALDEAGADWWHEYIPPSMPLDAARARIRGGPLR